MFYVREETVWPESGGGEMTVFMVHVPSKPEIEFTLFADETVARASIELSYAKVPERKGEIEITPIHVHTRVTHL